MAAARGISLPCLLLFLLSTAALVQSKYLLKAPQEAADSFESADDVAEYLNYLSRYFRSVSRPRFGKRSRSSFDTAAATAEYINGLNKYLHSMSRPRFGKRRSHLYYLY
ncbi:hypothetical protein BOX15_Mlig007142g2 [Macrostomum lignano]|uniref:Neuropeptide Y n=1 Tax=Macrostomum lignano TaxID=282301 RepID=A0A267G2R3_9PLAT|nr:hypothetical protein BOX15_Mlig007142g2 [Macrostomum lignano]